MKKIIFITILYAFIPLTVSAQSFRISHVPAGRYTYDKFNNEVYYAAASGIFIKSLDDSSIRNCPFPNLPEFAHNSHQCVYGDGDSIIIYNFDNNSKFLVYGNLEYQYYEYIFSPNDKYLLFYRNYFSLADSTIYPMDFSPAYEEEYEWLDEETFILTCDEHNLCSYNFVSNTLDTIFVSSLDISTSSYNKVNEHIYYSLDEYENPKIYSFDLSTLLDSIVYDTANDSFNNCWDTFNWFQSMEWAPNNKRMLFFSFELDAGGTIYTFNPETDSLRKHTSCGGEGYEYFIRWLNNDTIAYLNTTTGFIEGYILDNTVAVKEIFHEKFPNLLEVSSFPNPFNDAVTIRLNGIIKEPEIIIYNMIGEEIKRFENSRVNGNSYMQVWTGKNNSGVNVSSGVYFVIVREKNNPLLIKGKSKIIYLK